MLKVNGFLSTPSARRATALAEGARESTLISIHALREEGDHVVVQDIKTRHQFLSTPSARRATTIKFTEASSPDQFLSTPSARRATTTEKTSSSDLYISIHALREEGDDLTEGVVYVLPYFYPRPPRGGRPSRISR